MLRPAQKEVRSFLQTHSGMHVTGLMHRGAGKSYLACVLAVEKCLAKPHQNVKYVGPTAKMVRSIAMPAITRILNLCPQELKPKYVSEDGCYRFNNGSALWLAGADGGSADYLRGTDTHFAVLDGEGFMANPEYIIGSVLAPRAATVGGKLLHISSPPKTPAHPFASRVAQAASDGTLFRLSLQDNKYLSQEEKNVYAESMGGWDTVACRREYGCEIIMDEQFAVLPELLRRPLVGEATHDNNTLPRIVVCSFRPVGATSGILACVRPDGKLIIEKEFILPFGSADDIRKAVKSLQNEHDVPCEAYANITPEDQSKGLDFLIPLEETDLARSIWTLRTTIGSEKLSVSSECPHAMRHLHGCIWKDTGKSFESSGDGLEFDFVTSIAQLAYRFAGAEENKALSRNVHGRHILGGKNGSGSSGGSLWENPNANVPRGIRSLLRNGY